MAATISRTTVARNGSADQGAVSPEPICVTNTRTVGTRAVARTITRASSCQEKARVDILARSICLTSACMQHAQSMHTHIMFKMDKIGICKKSRTVSCAISCNRCSAGSRPIPGRTHKAKKSASDRSCHVRCNVRKFPSPVHPPLPGRSRHQSRRQGMLT